MFDYHNLKKSGMQISLRQRGIFLMRKNSNYQKIKFMNLHASNDIVVNRCKSTEKYQDNLVESLL